MNLSIDLTAEELATQQQLLRVAGVALASIDPAALDSLLHKFQAADTVLPIARPSDWHKIAESAKQHIKLVETFSAFCHAAATLKQAALDAGVAWMPGEGEGK